MYIPLTKDSDIQSGTMAIDSQNKNKEYHAVYVFFVSFCIGKLSGLSSPIQNVQYIYLPSAYDKFVHKLKC